jgi:hypothetical protein
VAKSYLPTSTVTRKRDGVDCSWVQFFEVAGPTSSIRSGGAISCMECMVLQSFATGRNQSYIKFWVITDSRAGGRSRSLDGRKYSYVTVGAIMGFSGEAVGLKRP